MPSTEGGHVAERQHVVDQLGHRAAAELAHVDHVGAERLQHRQRIVEHLLVAAHHDGDGRGFGARRAAAHRRIEHGDALGGHGGADLLHHRGRVGAEVDIGLALADIGQDAVIAQGHGLDVLGHGQRGHHHVGALGHLGDRLGRGGAEIGAGLHRGGVQIEHRDLVVALLDDVAAHGTAHVADADESNFHCFLPLIAP